MLVSWKLDKTSHFKHIFGISRKFYIIKMWFCNFIKFSEK